ncbi:hypothetical protein ACF1A5_03585 [Streptomyces sp. NPDC014864]|uniref:hypothetical protein n=1 Tax=Streptomyces sp. NPDC014864 TaxID=3364924 RepID=UPI0036F74EA3
MRSGVQNFSSSVAGVVSPGVPLALGAGLGVSGGPDTDGDAVVASALVEGALGAAGVVGVASLEGEADRDGLNGELLGPPVTEGVASAHADVGMKVAAIAVATARLDLSLKIPPCSDAHGPWSAARSIAIVDPIRTHHRT